MSRLSVSSAHSYLKVTRRMKIIIQVCYFYEQNG
jgi:hypothetical protein